MNPENARPSLDGAAGRFESRLRDYIAANLETVLKPPSGCLRHPFIDPGSIYRGNLWDWDSFWAVYGILNFIGHSPPADQALRERCIAHARGNVQNFFDHQLGDGYIPMLIEASDSAIPYLNRKHLEAVVMNMHKPFLCRQIALISDFSGDYFWAEVYFDNLEKYFELYDSVYKNAASGLYVWANDIMIGMDNDPASFGRPGFSVANIFLNSFMVQELRAMSRLCDKWGRAEDSLLYGRRAEDLAGRILEECWDSRDRFFYSVDVDVKTRRYDWFHKGLGVFWKTLPIKIRVWSGFLPMTAGFATDSQAASLVHLHATDESTFCAPFGITSLAMDERMYNLSATTNPSNWLGPIWMVANYAVFRGFLNYGYRDEAAKICQKSLALLGRDLETSGTLHEYYNPQTGEPVMNGGFINWNILALNMADELRGARAMEGFAGSL